jgi:hypothetical protein
MVLSLITPADSDFIKDFPAQNAVNCDVIDSYAGASLTTSPLQTYVPQLTAFTTNPSLGVGGTIVGYYYEIFDQIYTWGSFRFGTSGISIGTGTYMVSLPFPAQTIVGVNTAMGSAPCVGVGLVHDEDTSSGRLPVTAHLRTTSQMAFAFKNDSGFAFRDVRDAGPIVWAINDGMNWSARYTREP